MNYEVPQILNMMLKSMFPGDLDNCIPSIVALDDYQKRIMKLDGVEKFTSIITSHDYSEKNEINKFIALCKFEDADDIVKNFVAECVNYYFGHSLVITPLTNKKSPLFPNETVLDHINYELLEPVYLRGAK
jgi:hypothetical protein